MIRALFDRWVALRPSDPRAWRSGYPPLPEAEVAAFERRGGFQLPASYRRYLTEFGLPAHGLMHYGPAALDRQADERSALPFPLDSAWAGTPDEIEEWAEENEGDFFEEGPGEFYGQFDDPRTVFRKLPDGARGTDGTLVLGATRSHMMARLVLNGPWAGTVWFDSFGYDGGLLEPVDGPDAWGDGLREFFEPQEWLPLAEQPWFPPLPDDIADPAPGDFLDLTIAWLRHRVRQAEAEIRCDALEVEVLLAARRRLDAPQEFGFPSGHFYGSFATVLTRSIRDELLRIEPDPQARNRLADRTAALLGADHLPAALILAGRWRELADHARTRPESGRSAADLALAAAMLGTGADLPAQPIGPRTGLERWIVLDTLVRASAEVRQSFLDRIPGDAEALRIAGLPITTAALDDLLTGGGAGALDRDAATVLLVRALHGTPDPALLDRLCALAVAADRLGEVFHLLTAASGGRWPDRAAAYRDGRAHLDAVA